MKKKLLFILLLIASVSLIFVLPIKTSSSSNSNMVTRIYEGGQLIFETSEAPNYRMTSGGIMRVSFNDRNTELRGYFTLIRTRR